jgi:hypothetical protein
MPSETIRKARRAGWCGASIPLKHALTHEKWPDNGLIPCKKRQVIAVFNL